MLELVTHVTQAGTSRGTSSLSVHYLVLEQTIMHATSPGRNVSAQPTLGEKRHKAMEFHSIAPVLACVT